jgi:hypothetical protein
MSWHGGLTVSAQIVELTVPFDIVSGYTIYEKGNTVRAVLMNVNALFQTLTGTRPSIHIDLIGVPLLTLGGQSYETAEAKVSGTETLQNISVALVRAEIKETREQAAQGLSYSDIYFPSNRI